MSMMGKKMQTNGVELNKASIVAKCKSEHLGRGRDHDMNRSILFIRFYNLNKGGKILPHTATGRVTRVET